MRTWTVPADFTTHLAAHEPANGIDPSIQDRDPFAGGLQATIEYHHTRIEEALVGHGIPFGPGTFAKLDPYDGTLTVCNERDHLDRIGGIIDAIGPMKMFVLDDTLFRTNEPLPNPRLQARIAATTRKLQSIIIPEVEWESTTLEEAFAILEKRVRELDNSEEAPGKTSLRFRIEAPPPPEVPDPGLGPSSPGQKQIRELRLKNVPVVTVLQYMCDSSAIRYRIEEDGVTLLPIGVPSFIMPHWHVAPALMEELRFGDHATELPDHDDPFAEPVPIRVKADRAKLTLTYMLRENGVSFPEGASVRYDAATSILEIKNAPWNVDLAEELFTRLTYAVSRRQAGR